MGYEVKQKPDGKYALVKKKGGKATAKSNVMDLAKGAIAFRLDREKK